jgi:phosphatidylserine/phosphatidylglycerophosphate/cardiolipin synthase-like enzyme
MREPLTMKRFLPASAVLTALLICVNVSDAFEVTLAKDTPAQVFFSPDGGFANIVIKNISEARSEIFIQSYYFGSFPIAEALIEAHKKGVRVELIVDKADRAEGVTPGIRLSQEGIPVFLDGRHNIANNRVMIVDRRRVLTGSFDFNKASEQAIADNLLVVESPQLAELYRENWLRHRGHSETY